MLSTFFPKQKWMERIFDLNDNNDAGKWTRQTKLKVYLLKFVQRCKIQFPVVLFQCWWAISYAYTMLMCTFRVNENFCCHLLCCLHASIHQCFACKNTDSFEMLCASERTRKKKLFANLDLIKMEIERKRITNETNQTKKKEKNGRTKK